MKIEGLDNLLRKFAKLKQIDVEPIMEDASLRIRDEARNNVAVDTAELKLSIFNRVYEKDGKIIGEIYTNKEHGMYVELGTGPEGQANHKGISPNVNPRYSPTGWVYPTEKPIIINGKETNFIYTEGMPARPFLYPALHDNRDKLKEFFRFRINKLLKEASR